MSYDFSADTQSLYLHWPFCPYRCRFCPFVAMFGHEQYMGEYHAALQQEIAIFAKKYTGNRTIRTLYLGGGTPSTWPNNLLLDTFGTLKSEFVLNKSSEITIEVNPGTVTRRQVVLWRGVGINRVSVGVQSLNDLVLQNLGRYQTAAQVQALIPQLATHFDNISVDLILGFPGVLPNEWKKQLAQIVAWPLTHLSLYFLSLDPFTRLERDVRMGTCVLPAEQEVLETYYWSIDFLVRQGFEQYEISNFARPGYESLHNRAYWERKTYKGFGLGAWSYDGVSRVQNRKSLLPYMHGIQRGDDITEYSERLTPEQVRLEKIMLGLRQTRGVCTEDLMADRSIRQQETVQNTIARLVQEQLLVECAGRIFLTPAGYAVENSVAVALCE